MAGTLGNAVRWRKDFLLRRTPFSWAERISFVAPMVGIRSSEDLLRRHLAHDGAGRPCFDLGGLRLYFTHEANDAPVGEEALRGATTILDEAFVTGCDFFRGPVRIRPGDVVFDLGGNIGTSAIAFARELGATGRVYSFEPVFHEVIASNMAVNDVAGVEVVRAAVGDAAGTVEFSVSDIGIDSRMAASGQPGRPLRVPVTTLDRFVGERALDRVDFIKMDIEGAEELALRGAPEVMRRFRPVWSIASYHTGYDGYPQHPRLAEILRRNGYRIIEVPGRHIYAW